MMGGGIRPGLAAVWLLFLAESVLIRALCAAYLLFLPVAGLVGISRGEDPAKWLLVLGLVTAFGVWAAATHKNWKKWP